MIYLNKLLPIFLSPIFVVIVLVLLSLYCQKRSLSFWAIFILYVASNPVVGKWAMHYLEKDFQPSSAENIPEGDYVLVLGGMLRPIETNTGEIRYELNDAADRFMGGIEIYQLQRAPKIIFTRGQLPWRKGAPEGDILEIWAEEMGVPAEDILLTNTAQNTAQEAKGVRELVPEGSKIILVTSAYHMPRALIQFQNEGLAIIPYAVDFRVSASVFSILDLFPNADALSQSSLFIREMIGRAYYSIRIG